MRGHELPAAKHAPDKYQRAEPAHLTAVVSKEQRRLRDVVRYALSEAMKERYAFDKSQPRADSGKHEAKRPHAAAILLRSRITIAAAQTDRNPSEAQKRAGNYAKGKFWLWGHEVSIENPKGSTRSGVSKSGQAWSVTMQSHYGYIRRTLSQADGDAVDCFIGPHPESEIVFIVNQQTAGGQFDEHKCVIGCRSLKEAKQLYLANYSTGWTGLRDIVPMTKPHFLKWLQRGNTRRAVKWTDSIERYAAEFDESKHKRGQPDNAGQFATFGTHIDDDSAAELVGQLRDGDATSKNGGIKSHRLPTGPLVMSKIPTDYFDQFADEDHGNTTGFLRATTSPKRVKAYQALDGDELPPIYVATNRKGKHVLSDGGHRLVAAINRGDKFIRALVSPSLHEELHGKNDLSSQRFWTQPPVPLKGDEIATFQEPLDMRQLRQAAKAYAEHSWPADMTNEETGWKLIVNKKGVSDALSHGSGPQKIQAIAAIPSLLRQATLVSSTPNRHGKPLTDHVFASRLKIGEEVFAVGMVVHEDSNGRRFYDHELMEMKNLDQVLSQVGAASQSEVGRPAPDRGSIDKIVLNWLQVNQKSE